MAIFFTALDDSYFESILWHVQVCYADAFAVLRLLHIDWSAPLASVSAFVTAFLGDPLGWSGARGGVSELGIPGA